MAAVPALVGDIDQETEQQTEQETEQEAESGDLDQTFIVSGEL